MDPQVCILTTSSGGRGFLDAHEVEIRFPKTYFSKGEAWEKLRYDPPEVLFEGRSWRPQGMDLGPDPNTRKKRRANPWNAEHREAYWCYRASWRWVPGKIRRKMGSRSSPKPQRKNRYEILSGDDRCIGPTMEPNTDRIVFPLDVPHEAQAWEWCLKLRQKVGVMKVGLQLFTRHGPSALAAPKGNGIKVFLDLKLHDIPNTVARATESAVSHGVDFLSVHASGGLEMMKAAVEASSGSDTTILAITALTSLDEGDLKQIYGMSNPQDVVLNLAKMAYEAGARGFVCSPKEVELLKSRFHDATFVVPGIRPAGSAVNDQKRVATPESAIKAGADYLVIGRPIRNADDPAEAARAIGVEIAQALASR